MLELVSEQTEALERDGFVVSENAIPTSLCADLLQLILTSAQEQQPDYILQSKFRLHSPLPYNFLTRQAMSSIVEPYYEMLAEFFRPVPSADMPADLVELSSITVFPHADEQDIHPDEQNESSRLISVFVNLAPTTADAGALQIIPGSHKDLVQRHSADEAIPVELPAGSAVFMNSKTWHGGRANRTLECIRPVFYFSLGEPNLDGPTYSIRPEVAALNVGLADLRQPGLRRTSWTAASIPIVPPNLQVVQSVERNARRLFALEDEKIVDECSLDRLSNQLEAAVRAVVSAPGENSLDDLRSKHGADPLELVRFFIEYGKRGWFCFEE